MDEEFPKSTTSEILGTFRVPAQRIKFQVVAILTPDGTVVQSESAVADRAQDLFLDIARKIGSVLMGKW